jgi:hypothetical protein
MSMDGMQILAKLSGIGILVAIAFGLFVVLFGFVLDRPPQSKDESEMAEWKRNRPLVWIVLAVVLIVTVILVAER